MKNPSRSAQAQKEARFFPIACSYKVKCLADKEHR